MNDKEYKQIAPNKEVENIDASIAARMVCKQCNVSMSYMPYYSEKYHSYIAVAKCPKCKKEIAF